MSELIRIDEVLPALDKWLILDVRAPLEFQAGHIPGAVNLPLFTDEERARVGTIYTKSSPELAMKEGFKIAGTKMDLIVEQAREIQRGSKKQTLVQCWRGGKRSEAVQWLLSFSGISSSRLEGGYKAFRQSAHFLFNHIPQQLKIVGGFTGSGKTEVLHELKRRGHQVIDFEKLANHKGSAFGSIGEPEQPSNEQFENELYLRLLKLDITKPVWIENESKSIGRVYIPDGIWNHMKHAELHTINVDEEIRIDRIIRLYADQSNNEELKLSFHKIRDRLGGLEFQNAIKALENNDLRKAAAIGLWYYDKAYQHQIDHWEKSLVKNYPARSSVNEIVDLLEGPERFTAVEIG